MAYIQQIFKDNKDIKLVLSEEVYTHLAGCINLCGLSMGVDNREFGTILYGKTVDNNTINFEICSKYHDYQTKTGSFTLSENMWNELVKKTSSGQFNCAAHVHTHPNLGYEYNRFLSSTDIDFYKKMSSNLGEKFYTFGCMLSVSGDNLSCTDDISFVYCNPKTKEIFNVPNIYVRIDGIEMPLKKVEGTYEAAGVTHSFERTLFELDESIENNPITRR